MLIILGDVLSPTIFLLISMRFHTKPYLSYIQCPLNKITTRIQYNLPRNVYFLKIAN